MAASNNAPTTLLVDCGSGFTRAKVFIAKSEGVTEVEAGKYCDLEKWMEKAIVATLKEGPSEVRRWIEQLRKLVERCGCDRAIVGATGGLRNAVSSGEVSPAMLDDLRKSFEEIIPAVVFKELSAEQEAAAELSAVQYVASLALPSDASQPVGLISGGGMSCQVAYYVDADSSPMFLSLDADMKSTSNQMVDEDSIEAALVAFEARLAGLVSGTGLSGKLTGTFCVIEMLGYLGESKSQFPMLAALNLGKRLLNKAEVVHALHTHLEDWMGRNQRVSDHDTAYTGLLPKCLLGLLELFHDNACFYLCRIWPVGPATIKPDWSLGVHAVQARQATVSVPGALFGVSRLWKNVSVPHKSWQALPVLCQIIWKRNPSKCSAMMRCGFTNQSRLCSLKNCRLSWWEKLDPQQSDKADECLNFVIHQAVVAASKTKPTVFTICPSQPDGWQRATTFGGGANRTFTFDTFDSDASRDEWITAIQQHIDLGNLLRKQIGEAALLDQVDVQKPTFQQIEQCAKELRVE